MQEDHSIDMEERESELLELLVPFTGCMPQFRNTAGGRCMLRGLLPGHLLSCLDVLEFLSYTVISAQKAQRRYGVRASVLLSMAIDEFSFDVRELARDPTILRERDDKRKISPNIDRWFLNRAKQLATRNPLKTALKSPSVKRYINWICDLGFGDSMKALDLWHNIEIYHLEECDMAGMLPVGEYVSDKYDKVEDEAGNTTSLKLNPYWDLVEKARGSEWAA